MKAKKTHKQIRKEKSLMIPALLEQGVCTKTRLSRALEISLTALHQIFKEQPDLEAKFLINKTATVGTAAADGIVAAVLDDKDKNHYNACKHITDKYKTPLDEVLEAKDGGEGFNFSNVPSGKRLIIEDSE